MREEKKQAVRLSVRMAVQGSRSASLSLKLVSSY
jgi:hypothetical protein